MTATLAAAAGVMALCRPATATARAGWAPASRIAPDNDWPPLVAFDQRGNAAITYDYGGAAVDVVRWTHGHYSRPTRAFAGDGNPDTLRPLSLALPPPGAIALLIEQDGDPGGPFCCRGLDALVRPSGSHDFLAPQLLTTLHEPADGQLVADSSGGLVAALEESPQGTPGSAYVRMLAPGQRTFGPPQPLQAPGASPTGGGIAASPDAVGGAFATWLASASGAVCPGDTVEVAYRPAGAGFGPGRAVARAPREACMSDLEIAAGGSRHAAVWVDDHSRANGTFGNSQLRVAVGGRNGFHRARALTSTLEDVQEVHVSVSRDGTTAVAFVACGPSTCSIEVALDDAHGRFGRPQVARSHAGVAGAGADGWAAGRAAWGRRRGLHDCGERSAWERRSGSPCPRTSLWASKADVAAASGRSRSCVRTEWRRRR